MQGLKTGQEDLFFYGSLDSLVPADDPYRRLDDLLDFSWLRRETRSLYGATGRPSIDPVVIAKLLLIAYLQGITSERELIRQVQVNLSYRRFLHYQLSETPPDHSSLTRSRQRLGETAIRKIFEYVLRLCLDAGLVGSDMQSVDSTFVQANASLRSLRPRLVEVEAKRFTKKLFSLNPVSPEDGADEDAGHPRRRGSGVNDAYRSKTDPESALDRRKRGKSRLGYLVHYAVDRSKQIITGVLTTGAQQRDAAQLVPLIDQVLEQDITVQAVAADRGYSSGEVYRGLSERRIKAFIPQQRRGGEVHGYFGHEAFVYDAETDRYLCPNGAWLTRQKSRGPERRYKASVRACAACPLRSRCTSAKARTLNISPFAEELAAARRQQETPAARRAARTRRICSERTFAEAKERHGLRRAQRRGLSNAHVQALLTATAINLKRYLQAQTRAFGAAQAARARLTTCQQLFGRSTQVILSTILHSGTCNHASPA